jgi:hypothetical protein
MHACLCTPRTHAACIVGGTRNGLVSCVDVRARCVPTAGKELGSTLREDAKTARARAPTVRAKRKAAAAKATHAASAAACAAAAASAAVAALVSWQQCQRQGPAPIPQASSAGAASFPVLSGTAAAPLSDSAVYDDSSSPLLCPLALQHQRRGTAPHHHPVQVQVHHDNHNHRGGSSHHGHRFPRRGISSPQRSSRAPMRRRATSPQPGSAAPSLAVRPVSPAPRSAPSTPLRSEPSRLLATAPATAAAAAGAGAAALLADAAARVCWGEGGAEKAPAPAAPQTRRPAAHSVGQRANAKSSQQGGASRDGAAGAAGRPCTLRQQWRWRDTACPRARIEKLHQQCQPTREPAGVSNNRARKGSSGPRPQQSQGQKTLPPWAAIYEAASGA